MAKLVKRNFVVLVMLVIGAISLMGCQQGEGSNVTIEVTDESGSNLPAQVKLIPDNEQAAEKFEQKLSKEGAEVQFKNLPTGIYEMKISKDGYLSTSKYLVVKEDNVTKNVQLKKELLTLTVKSMLGDESGEAKVEILQDGKKITSREGKTVEFRLEEGVYTVRASKEGYLTTTKYLALKDSGTEVTLKLKKAEKKSN